MRKFISAAAVFSALLFFSACSLQKKIAKEAGRDILNNPDFRSAHIGITLYDPASGQYLYDHQGDKFFVPASNTKLFTCYAVMKNLGDSLLSIRYIENGNGSVTVYPNGDPSFLHPDFSSQRVFDFLKKHRSVMIGTESWRENALGFGWAWDDYNSDYMAERSLMPIYGNLVRFTHNTATRAIPSYFQNSLSDSGWNGKESFSIRREPASNSFYRRASNSRFATTDIPIYTRDPQLLVSLLADTLHTRVGLAGSTGDRQAAVKMYSQPTDSLLKIMMHRSDNFFAEQTLLMVSNEKLGFMSDARIIDTLLKTDFVGLPQKPKWVDGSGLSRYNLISPQDFVWVLTQMKNEFRWERISTILATGGEGTISSYYKNYSGRIYAKTGSLSNHLALSGYITTKKGRQLIFSVLVNAELAPPANIRKGVEKFLTAVMDGN
ncbi:MAG: D-alanyl-D-alanine carboxypeptidase [Chitinophagaceae bacterium]|nr:D-alanyl-D-alanine carboxypeptidase [Chitinophagaceae bacterium]